MVPECTSHDILELFTMSPLSMPFYPFNTKSGASRASTISEDSGKEMSKNFPHFSSADSRSSILYALLYLSSLDASSNY